MLRGGDWRDMGTMMIDGNGVGDGPLNGIPDGLPDGTFNRLADRLPNGVLDGVLDGLSDGVLIDGVLNAMWVRDRIIRLRARNGCQWCDATLVRLH